MITALIFIIATFISGFLSREEILPIRPEDLKKQY